MVTSEPKTVNIEDGDDEYQITFLMKWETYLYGADADGNRGERRTELLDFEVIDSYKNGHVLLAKDIPIDVMTQAVHEVEQ